MPRHRLVAGSAAPLPEQQIHVHRATSAELGEPVDGDDTSGANLDLGSSTGLDRNAGIDGLGERRLVAERAVDPQDVRDQVVGEGGEPFEVIEEIEIQSTGQVGRRDLGPLVEGDRHAFELRNIAVERHLGQGLGQTFRRTFRRFDEGDRSTIRFEELAEVGEGGREQQHQFALGCDPEVLAEDLRAVRRGDATKPVRCERTGPLHVVSHRAGHRSGPGQSRSFPDHIVVAGAEIDGVERKYQRRFGLVLRADSGRFRTDGRPLRDLDDRGRSRQLGGDVCETSVIDLDERGVGHDERTARPHPLGQSRELVHGFARSIQAIIAQVSPNDAIPVNILSAARAWNEEDPDPATADALGALIEQAEAGDQGAFGELTELFTGRIAFGTAGLRAALGPGPNRMNRLVVRQTTAGLMRWLPESPTVVIGYDARHGSLDFANDTAAVVVAAGGRAELLPCPLPTPVLAHAVLTRGADAGVMITASHNPAQDNGYKLYLDNGIQLVAPADAEIAQAINEAAKAPVAVVSMTDDGITTLDDTVAAGHIVAALGTLSTDDREVSVVYTAMHGVGGNHILRAFEAGGFAAPEIVEEQFEPDPDFPTAVFPNPEEAGALDLALALARRVGADGILANDPDADRLAMAVPDRSGAFVQLSGDELGVLLADHLIRNEVGADHPGGRVVANSVVSSQLLGSMAKRHGITAVVTLTGFKWVARPIVEQPEKHYLLGYEEAIGYCVGGVVRDKDGISAALVAAEMLAGLKRQGLTVWDRLDALAVEFGVHLTGPVTIRLDGADGIERRTELMEQMVRDPPEHLGGEARSSFENLENGAQFPPATGVILFYGTTRVIIRPSGTEPKLKAYIEVVEPVEVGPSGLADAKSAAEARLAAVQADLRALLA